MIRGQGMPSYRHHDFGNMYVRFNVKFPERNWSSDPATYEGLRKLLPAANTQQVPAEAMTEPADLEDMDNAQQSRVFGGGHGGAMDEDDEDGHPGGERVQCASQ